MGKRNETRVGPRGAARAISTCMSNPDEPHDQKKVTAATTDQPQEEFIAPEPQPSKPDPDAEKKSPPASEPPRP